MKVNCPQWCKIETMKDKISEKPEKAVDEPSKRERSE
jgi:hypothetical protein